VPVVGLVDAHLPLHRRRREADLVPADGVAALDPVPHLLLLDPVRVLDARVGIRLDQRLDRLARGIGPRQCGGGLLHLGDIHLRDSAVCGERTQARTFRPAELSPSNLLRAR